MSFTNKDILLASLLGSKAVEQIPRLAAVENELAKHVGIPIPIIPFRNVETFDVKEYNIQNRQWLADYGAAQFVPLRLRRSGTEEDWFELPYEPLISVSGSNIIAKRKVAKAPGFIGTVKEYWAQDDYEITITGALYGREEIGDFAECFPREDFERLKNYCISPSGLDVDCPLLEILDIRHIVVESFEFPFSKGENVQGYTIKALSDFSAEFLIEQEG